MVRESHSLRHGLRAAALCAAAVAAADESAPLRISITGVASGDGAVAVAVFDSADAYEARDGAVAKSFVPIVGDAAAWRTELAAGRQYVVLAYHDVNGNGRLDTRVFGIPKEPVGIYKADRTRFRPPGFDEASFLLPAGGMSIRIDLRSGRGAAASEAEDGGAGKP